MVKQHAFTKTTELGEVRIRSYQNSDQELCLGIYKNALKEWPGRALRVDFKRYCMYLTVVMVSALVTLAFTWSAYICGLYFGISVITVVLYFGNAYYNAWKITDASLKADLKNIGKTYMSSAGCHMWVAECNRKVVGMVGLLHNESHEPGVAELYRMYVLSSYRRMGIARKLLERLVSYAREQRYHKIILNTTSSHKAALGFYKKSGFELTKVLPFEQKLPTDIELNYFELHLY